jgi:4-diphosphocytidyl-2-C-methyl-D-erythritol kinase
LETLLYPIPIFDRLTFARGGSAIQLTCNHPALPTDSRNLVYKAGAMFLEMARISDGVRVHLEKRIPLEAGLGGGSANAAVTLTGLNELFEYPLTLEQLRCMGAKLGSDVPFFLQDKPALATGRGENIAPLEFFPALRGTWFLLIHPGFGISTAWAYQRLARYNQALNGTPGCAQRLIDLLQTSDARTAGVAFYNALEQPAFHKYPLLDLYQQCLRFNGAAATLMSGSGSSTFAIADSEASVDNLIQKFRNRFGDTAWLAKVHS